jgi:predicted dehydrogenase
MKGEKQMAPKTVKVGLIGSGAISYTYLDNMTKRFDILDVVGCSDIIPERSEKRAKEFNIRQMTNEEIYADPEIEIVVNTTYPRSHYEVTKAALEAGKHVYSEKMLAVNFEEAKELYDLAKSKGLRLSCAPDTFLGAGYQTCRKLIDDGFVGIPLSVHAVIIRGYHDNGKIVHDTKPFVLDDGGTIPFDMGGYYIHAMVNLFGPVKRVAGFGRTHENKVYHNPFHPNYKQPLPLNSPTIIQVSLEFESGVYGTLTCCDEGFFGPDIQGITVYGTNGTLICPDPNTFGGPVKLLVNGGKEYIDMPLTHGYSGEERAFRMPGSQEQDFMAMMWAASRRGIGVADIAWAIRNNRAHRCSAELALHAIEIVHAAVECDRSGKVYEMTSRPDRPEALPSGFISCPEAVFDTN